MYILQKTQLFIVELYLARILVMGVQLKPISTIITTMKTKLNFVLFLIRNRALLNYIRIYKKYILDPKCKFFSVFSNLSWISAIYMLYSDKDEFIYWREIDKKWQQYIKQ